MQGTGMILKIHQLSNYIPVTSTFVKTTLYHGSRVFKLKNKLEAKFETKKREYANVKRDHALDERPGDDVYGRYLRFGEEIMWDANFYSDLKNDREEADLILLIEVFETWDTEVDMEADNRSDASKRAFMQGFNRIEAKNGYRLYGYTSLKLNNADFTVKYGNYTVNLFKPPINIKRRFLKDMIPDKQIKLTVQMPIEQLLDDIEEEKRAEASRLRKEQQALAAASTQPYIEGPKTKLDPKKLFEFGRGIDFYIDQARFLPENCTHTRLMVRGLTKEHQKLIKTEKVLADIDSSSRHYQNYDYRMEIRPDTLLQPGKQLDPTLTLEIMIETIDRVDMVEKIVGFCYFPLFLGTDLKSSPFNSDAREFLANQGSF